MQTFRPELLAYPTLLDRPQMITSLTILRDDYNYFEKKCEEVQKCILLTEDNPQDESAAFFLPFYIQAREEVTLMKRKLEEATLVFKMTKEFYGDKMESEDMARFVIDFRQRVIALKKKPKVPPK